MRRFYHKTITTLFLSFSIYTFLGAQPVPAERDDDLPKDYLTKDFHAGRREALRSMMPANSVVVVFAYPTRTFSNDVEYLYHQNPDMYYFSGYKEPHSVLLIFKEAINNAARHSGCSNVEIGLRIDRGLLVLRVRDDGRGFDPEASAEGNGVASMRRRARGLGGELVVTSETGKGSEVVLRVPRR